MSLITGLDLIGYIDAGTGSYLLAAIASGAAGLWMFFRSGMARLRRKVKGEKVPEERDSESVLSEGETEEPVARG